MYYSKTAWGNCKKTEVDGKKYDSKFEAGYAQELILRERAGDIAGWQRQVKIPLEVNGYHICNYYIDFIVEHKDGTLEYVECKGVPTEVWKMKWKIFEALYSEKPDVVLTVVNQGKQTRPKLRKAK